ncbi:MAG: carboxypeptidase-like regulatory domain-containing protein, partial [Planctomycetota bacterium]
MPAPTLGGFWPHWLWPGDPRPPNEIDDEVAEELRLHLDLMAEEAERRGASPDAARAEAAERFGDFDDLVRRCRREKQGDAPMLRRVQTVLVLLLLAAVGAVAWQQLEMRNQIVASQNNINQQFNALRRTLSGITPVAIADNAWSSGVVWADQSKPTRFGTVTRQAAGAYSAPTYSAPAPTEPLEPVRGWGQNERASTGWAPEGPSAPTYAADYARTVSRLIAVQDPSGRPIGGARIQVVASARSPNDTIASGVTDSEGHWKLHAGLQRGAV